MTAEAAARPTVLGACRQGRRASAGGRHLEARQFHGACPGTVFSRPGEVPVRCGCHCHRDGMAGPMAEALAGARRQRMLDAGVDPDARSRERDGRRFCRHDHEMTEQNTGPRGEFRACKREASRRCKARRAEGNA